MVLPKAQGIFPKLAEMLSWGEEQDTKQPRGRGSKNNSTRNFTISQCYLDAQILT